MKLSNLLHLGPKMRLRGRKFGRPGGEEGSAIYEFAMVLPVLSMLLIGIIYGGITFYDYVTLAEAVSVGARSLAINAGNSTPCTTAETALTNAATSLNSSLVTISISFPTTNINSDSCTNLYINDYAMVNATYPCSMTVPFTGINLCPISGPSSTTNSSGATTMSCPYTSCISSTTVVRLE